MISLSLLTTTHKAHWLAHPSWNAYTTCERQDATQATIVNGVCPALCFSTSLGLFLTALSLSLTFGRWQKGNYSLGLVNTPIGTSSQPHKKVSKEHEGQLVF